MIKTINCTMTNKISKVKEIQLDDMDNCECIYKGNELLMMEQNYQPQRSFNHFFILAVQLLDGLVACLQ